MTELRRLRLSQGWEPTQLIGRMKILAASEGITLPHVYLLVRLVFLWENHRAPMPYYYVGLLDRIYGGRLTGFSALRAASSGSPAKATPATPGAAVPPTDPIASQNVNRRPARYRTPNAICDRQRQALGLDFMLLADTGSR